MEIMKSQSRALRYSQAIACEIGIRRRLSIRQMPNPLACRYFQNCFVAMRAPSAIAANFAQTTCGSTAACPTQVP